MGERFERPPEERRRRGPLGDADAEETRQVPQGGTQEGAPGGTRGDTRGDVDPEATRQIPSQPAGGDERTRAATGDEADDRETRVIRTPGSGGTPRGTTRQEAAAYPSGYFEAAEEREDRLRDMYGGVDWLASFLGFVFAVVVGAIFSSVAGLVLGILGFSLDLSNLSAAVITGLAIVAAAIFLTYFFGGYVAGRLARFDGGRNGAMLLLWSVIAVLLVLVARSILSSFLPGNISQGLNNFVQNGLVSSLGNLVALGAVGIAVVVGALLLALLGGILGGRLGSRYHTEIDRTT